MEMEQLKQVYLNNIQTNLPRRSVEDLGQLLHTRASSAVGKLKRNLVFEGLIACLFLFFPAFIFSAYPGPYIQSFGLFLIVAIFLLLFRIVQMYKTVSAFEQRILSTSKHLLELLTVLKKFKRLYFLSTMILVPVFFLSGFFMLYFQNQSLDPLLFNVALEKQYLIYIILFLLWWIGIYLFTKWYVKTLFGKHITYLQSLLDELNS